MEFVTGAGMWLLSSVIIKYSNWKPPSTSSDAFSMTNASSFTITFGVMIALWTMKFGLVLEKTRIFVDTYNSFVAFCNGLWTSLSLKILSRKHKISTRKIVEERNDYFPHFKLSSYAPVFVKSSFKNIICNLLHLFLLQKLLWSSSN